MGKLNILKVTNMVVKGAVGRKSKQITQQILLDVKIGQYRIDGVFIIVPNLIWECIIGIGLLQQSRCIINLRDNQITFNRQDTGEDVPEYSKILPIEIDEEEE